MAVVPRGLPLGGRLASCSEQRPVVAPVRNLPVRHSDPAVLLRPVVLQQRNASERVETLVLARVLQEVHNRISQIRVAQVEAGLQQRPEQPACQRLRIDTAATRRDAAARKILVHAYQFIVGPRAKLSSRASSTMARAQDTTRSSVRSSPMTSRISAIRMACR